MPRKKNPNGMGSIDRKTVKDRYGNARVYWRARYTDPVTKKQVEMLGKTQSEVAEKLRKALSQIESNSYVVPAKIKVGEWLSTWLDMREQLEPGTKSKYESAIRVHILPVLGNIKLQSLQKIHCQQFANSLTSAGLQPKTVRNVMAVLSGALQEAVDNDMIYKNPAARLKLPPVVKKAPVAMSTELQREFEEAIKESPYRNVYLVALYTGMRISEVLGVRWVDLDRKTGTLKITGQLERKDGNTQRARKDTTKTHKDRTITLPPFVIGFLEYEQEQQKQNHALVLSAGGEWNNADGLVFTRTDGSPLPHRTVEHAFDRIKQKLGHPELTLHVLRKTWTTNQIQAGENVKTVSASLGHSGTGITLETYTAQREEDMRRMAERSQKEWEMKHLHNE